MLNAPRLAPHVWTNPPESGLDAGFASTPSKLIAAALDAIDYGVMLLDAKSARLHHANRLALNECAKGCALSIEHDRVRARERDNQCKLDRALALAASERRGMVSLQGETQKTLLAVLPLPCENDAPRALLLFGRRGLCESLSVGFFSRLHALTPSEDAVLKALCRGLKPTQIAADSGVAISTVRSQVSSIRLKTCSESIRDLLKTIAMLPPIPPAFFETAGTTH
jgi:DNA-binding NarL/FixJ family response regulator